MAAGILFVVLVVIAADRRRATQTDRLDRQDW
jgi:hypothetical protein